MHNRLRKPLSILAIPLAILAIVELSLRIFWPLYMTGNVNAYQYDAVLGVRLKDNLRMYRTTDYQQEILSNSLGTVNLLESFEAFRYRIFAIGDSYTQGTGLPFDASYPFQLAMLLNLRGGGFEKRYAVVNLGLSAFGLEQELLTLERYRSLVGNPHYVLYLGSNNDYQDDRLFRNGYRHRHLVDGNPHWGVLLKPLQWFANATEIGKRLKLIRGAMGRPQHGTPSVDTAGDRPIQEKTAPPPIAALQQDGLERLLRMTRRAGARLIVSWAELPDSPADSYQWLQHWARERDVDFADWHPDYLAIKAAIPGLPGRNPHSGGHFRTWVNQLIARSFQSRIQGHRDVGAP